MLGAVGLPAVLLVDCNGREIGRARRSGDAGCTGSHRATAARWEEERVPDIGAFGVVTAFAAGAASFLSPCVLPLVPAYVSYVTGQSLQRDRASASSRASAAFLSLCFVLGFSVVFVALGASATALGAAMVTGYLTAFSYWLLERFPALGRIG